MLALLYLSKADLSHLKDLSEYIEQFDFVESQFRNLLEAEKES